MCFFYWNPPEPTPTPLYRWEIKPVELGETAKTESEYERGFKAGFEAGRNVVREPSPAIEPVFMTDPRSVEGSPWYVPSILKREHE